MFLLILLCRFQVLFCFQGTSVPLYAAGNVYKTTLIWQHSLFRALYHVHADICTLIHSINIYSIAAMSQALYKCGEYSSEQRKVIHISAYMQVGETDKK